MKTLTNFKTTMLHYINLRTLSSVVTLVCCTQIGYGQVTIAGQDFETSLQPPVANI